MTHTGHGGAAITGRPKMHRWWRSDEADRTQMIYTILRTHPSPQIGKRRTGEGSMSAMAARHDGARHNPGNGAVESKTKRVSRSVAHHDHAGAFCEDGDGLEQPGHVESKVAELQPVSGKKTLRRTIPANPSDVSKPQRSARPRRSRWRRWARWTWLDGGYGERRS